MNKIFKHFINIDELKEWNGNRVKVIGKFREWRLNNKGSFEKIRTIEGAWLFLPDYNVPKVDIESDIAGLISGREYEFSFNVENSQYKQIGVDLIYIDKSAKVFEEMAPPKDNTTVGQLISEKVPTTESDSNEIIKQENFVEKETLSASHEIQDEENKLSGGTRNISSNPASYDSFLIEQVLRDKELAEVAINIEKDADDYKTGKISKEEFLAGSLKKYQPRSQSKHENDAARIVNSEIDLKILKLIGNKGELFLFNELQKENHRKIQWLNQEFIENDIETLEDSGMPYDFIIEDANGNEIYIECKATTNESMTFFLSSNEWGKLISSPRGNYQIHRVFGLTTTPSRIKIINPLEDLLNGKLVPYLVNEIREISPYVAYFTYLL